MTSTIYEWLGVPEDVEREMVGAAALLGSAAPSVVRSGARAVLSDPGAREDYDARASRGMRFELTMAWGVGAAAAGETKAAARFFREAHALAPDDRAAPLLLAAAESAPDTDETAPSPEQLAAARDQIERLRNNSAFPHRLVRYAAALAAEAPGATAIEDARSLVEADMAEAPRAYSMILPVLREHYAAVHALDATFFESSMAVLARHTPTAEYERGKAQARRPAAPVESIETHQMLPSPVLLPRLRVPDRRLYLRFAMPPLPIALSILGGALGWPGGAAGVIAGLALGYLAGLALSRLRRLRR